jgi:SAM-dependent methyltransferase
MMRPAFDRGALPYWEARAERWKVAPPLSPDADDVRFYEACAARRLPDDGREMVALVLGVTAPIAAMRWPQGTHLVALDWAQGMFHHVFPRGAAPAHSSLVRGDWREAPLRSGSFDFVVGDGCYSTFSDLAGPEQVNREVARVLRPGGEFCLRCFRRPDVPVAVEALFAELLAGRIRNLDLFRWMLAMAVHGDSSAGVSLNQVWREWERHVPDARAEQSRLGWSDEALANMQAWSRLESRYVFPSLAELRALAAPYFDLEACDLPEYEWGDQFPRLLMRRRGD